MAISQIMRRGQSGLTCSSGTQRRPNRVTAFQLTPVLPAEQLQMAPKITNTAGGESERD